MDDSIGQLLSLDGRTALVTGAATEIGAGIARVLRTTRASVVIANAVLFLSAGASSYVTGQNLYVDVGWTLV